MRKFVAEDSDELDEKHHHQSESCKQWSPVRRAFFLILQIEQHDDEKEQHHDRARVDEDLDDADEEGTESDEQGS